MRISQVTLADADRCDGVVVVVDVLRAFTVAALAMAAGARAIACVRTVEEALTLRTANPGSLAMGEHNRGRPIPGFDFGNSPSRLAGADLDGRLLIQRTSAGTQGLVAAATGATTLFAASFTCAKAIARAVRALLTDHVTFVLTGVDTRDGDEDRACADYIGALLDQDHVDPAPFLERVWTADAARAFTGTPHPDLPVEDVELAARADVVGFALRAELRDGHPTLLRWQPSG